MIVRRGAVVVAALAITLALTGCGRLGAQLTPGSDASSGAPSTSTLTPAADDSVALDGISQDLDAAGTANTEAGSNADAGDQAAATGDEP
jgi:predicted small lipoprotein YifL